MKKVCMLGDIQSGPRWCNRGITVLSVLGFAVTAFLTLAYLDLLPLYCESPIFDCGKIARHPLAHGLGIPHLAWVPTPVFGLLLFIALGGLSALQALAGTSRLGRLAARLQTILTGAALCVFAFLSYAEMFIIRAWCPWRVISALIVVGIAVLLAVAHRWERVQTNAGPFSAHVRESAYIVGVEAVWYPGDRLALTRVAA